VDDIAKRLIDNGFHAPTMSWPVAGTLMVEPTESETKAEIDRFITALLAIRAEIAAVEAGEIAAEDSPLRHAPHTVDDLVADWTRKYPRGRGAFPPGSFRVDKYWPPVGRVDNVYGDRNLVCTCPPVESYAAPAATEIEQAMIGWLRGALGLSGRFSGTIHDSATTATLSAVLTMRERALEWAGVQGGLSGAPRLRLYASAQTHSSVDKAARIAGIGQENLVKIPTDSALAMKPGALAGAIAADRAAGYLPIGVVICAGGTSVGAFDRVGDVVAVAKAAGLPTHVDAAWAGSAMICPEFRDLWAGVEGADSIVFNPHKWLGAQFDCSVQFIADPGPQIRTLGLRPTYLETPGQDEIVNFNEWTVPLGRSFRALKLWFLLRAQGLEDLRTRIRNHVAWSVALCETLRAMPEVEIVTEPSLSLFSFALRAGDAATEALLARINDDGRVYLTQTRHQGRFVIRVQVGSFDCTAADVAMVATVVRDLMP
jgi:aromatic-L-amino-acid/L-tryptophan decarboxylase